MKNNISNKNDQFEKISHFFYCITYFNQYHQKNNKIESRTLFH